MAGTSLVVGEVGDVGVHHVLLPSQKHAGTLRLAANWLVVIVVVTSSTAL
jgi:hypothetical protein